MVIETKPAGIGTFIGLTWRSALRAMGNAPLVFAGAAVALALIWIGYSFLERAIAHLPTSSWLLRQASGLAEFVAELVRLALMSFVLAPVAIAVHRLVILDDPPKGGAHLGERRVRLFVAWLFGFSVFAMIGELPTLVFGEGSFALKWLMIGFAMAILLRSALVFPAIAIDAPGGSIKERVEEAWRISRGHLGRLFLTTLIATLPLLIVGLIMWRMSGPMPAPDSEAAKAGAEAITVAKLAAAVMAGLTAGILRVASTAIGAAVTSWVYLWALDHPVVQAKP